jgi:CheY-like chemotaxis protein
MAFRILIADDEVLVALSLGDLLEADGHEVELTFDGAAALAAARRLGASIDVLVTDLNMPHLTGEALIRTLRAERPGLPVVVVTGSPPPGGVAELRAASGSDGPLILLHKPIDYAALTAAVTGTALSSQYPAPCPPKDVPRRPGPTACRA